MKTESIIFDLDGTLWDSSDNVAASWDEALKKSTDIVKTDMTITGDMIRSVMGMTMDAIAEKLFPELPLSDRTLLMDRFIANENSYLAVHGGRLFEGAEKTLSELAEKHRLFIVSNCQCGYIEAFYASCGMEKIFSGQLCWGDTGKPKGTTIRMLMEKHGIDDAVYVGDTQGDLDATMDAGLRFVHAAYGFGEIKTPEKVSAYAHSIGELTEIFE